MMNVDILSGTSKAKELLTGNGTVVGIFDKCFNIITDDNQLLTIFNNTKRFSTRALISQYQGSIYDLPISIDEKVLISGKKIKLNNVEFDFLDMYVHETYHVPCSNTVDQTAFEEFDAILNKYRVNSPLICQENPIYKKFNQGVNLLKTDIRNGFENLVGLGIGLTPSADDFLSGIAAFFHLINYSPKFNLALKKYLEQKGLERTTFVSCKLLEDVCDGHINDDLYNLIYSLVNQKEYIEILTKRMIDYGSTSGYETCLGILQGYIFYKNGDFL